MSQTAKTTASGTESRLVRVLESYLAACQAGSAPEQQEFLARHPELAEDLKDCLASLEFIGQGVLKPPLALPTHAGGAASGPPEAIQPEGPLGDYRIVREIGRGGMGVVYEAVQISLGRHVALKVLPFAAALDSKQLQRFKNEAQAAAHLHHTNIVPVFGVGCERGVHYYAMQYIEGQTLAAVIHEMQKKAGAREDTSPRESPSAKPEPAQSESRGAPPPDSQPSPETQSIAGRFTEGAPRKPDFYRAAAQLGIQAAEALDHAHQLGVVHRDIKPGNLLVDERGKLWITDFGLARFHNETGLTLSGDLLGTLRYMSPEQTLGNQALVDPRTDIYSLGATFYEFLTLRAVCDGTDRHQVLRQIEGAEPVSPRRLQPAIPADLETIILKTLAKEPASRYATAHELAEELERFLDDRPIQARRPTLVQRTRKWARRHRILVRSAAVSSLFLLLVATAGLGVGFYYVNAEKNRTEDARKGEAAQRRSAEQAAVDARAVLDFFQLQVLAAARPKNQDGGLGINATIRDAVHAAEPEIAGAFHDRPLVEASIRNTLGTSYWHWRENKAAIEQYERSLALRENQLGPNHPDTLTIMNNLATAYQANGQLDKALQLCEQTLAKRQEILGADHPDTLQSMNNLASAYRAVGQLDKALRLHEQTLAKRQEILGADHPNTLSSMSNLASAYRAAGQFDKGLPLDEQALAKSKDKLGPDHPDTLICMNNLAMAYSQAGRRDKALTLFEQTLVKRQEILGPDHPHTLTSMGNLAYAYQEVGQLDKALPLFEQTLAKRRNKLGPDHPDTITSMTNLAHAYQQKGDFANAEPLLRECLAFCEKKKPDAWPTFDTKSQLGASLLGQKKYAEAEPLLLAGYKGMKEHEAKIPASYKKYLTEALERLVQLYEALGKKDQAAQWRKELEDHHATKRH